MATDKYRDIIDEIKVTADDPDFFPQLFTQVSRKRKKSFAKKQAELTKLRAREVNAEIKAQAAAMADSLVGLTDSLMSQSALQDAFSNYESKVTKKEREATGTSEPITSVITYATDSVDDSTTVDKIDELLGTTSTTE